MIKSISPVPSKVQKTNTTLYSQQQFSATILTSLYMLLTMQHVMSYPIVQCASKNAHEQWIKPSLRLNYKRKHFILGWWGQLVYVTTNVSSDLVSFDGVFRTISGISIWWQVCIPELMFSIHSYTKLAWNKFFQFVLN